MKNMIITTKSIPFWKKGRPLNVHTLAPICRSPAVCFGASTHCFEPQVWVFQCSRNHQIYLLHLEHADSEIQKNNPESCQKIFFPFFYFWKALPWQISSLCTKDN